MGLFKKAEVEAMIDAGNNFFNEKNYVLAIATYSMALSEDPKNAGAECNIGFALNEMEQYENAMLHFTKALEMNPKLANAHFGKGNSQFQLQKYEEAITEYDKALVIDHKHVKAWHNKGYALHKLGKEELAMECIKNKYKCLGIKNYVILFHGWED